MNYFLLTLLIDECIMCSSLAFRMPPMGSAWDPRHAPVADVGISVPDADDLVAFPSLPERAPSFLPLDPALDVNPSAGPSESPALAPATQEATVPLSASESSALGWNAPWATSDWSEQSLVIANASSEQIPVLRPALLLNPNPRQSNASTLGRRQERHQAVQEHRQNVLVAFYDPVEGGGGRGKQFAILCHY